MNTNKPQEGNAPEAEGRSASSSVRRSSDIKKIFVVKANGDLYDFVPASSDKLIDLIDVIDAEKLKSSIKKCIKSGIITNNVHIFLEQVGIKSIDV